MSDAQTFTLEASRQAISAFADDFAEWADRHAIPESCVRAFQVAFDELLTNVIDYGLYGRSDVLLQVVLQPTPDTLEAWIIDNGSAFDPLCEAASPNLELSLEDRPIGGLGIHLVKSLIDRAEYLRDGDRNLLHLSKRHTG